MKIILALSKRNLRLFVRDKALVFFSFLSVIIILGLYVLFLGEIQVNNIKQSIGMDLPEIDALVYAWMLPGLIAVASMTLLQMSITFFTGTVSSFFRSMVRSFF